MTKLTLPVAASLPSARLGREMQDVWSIEHVVGVHGQGISAHTIGGCWAVFGQSTIATPVAVWRDRIDPLLRCTRIAACATEGSYAGPDQLIAAGARGRSNLAQAEVRRDDDP